jgi:hypothetical protein
MLTSHPLNIAHFFDVNGANCKNFARLECYEMAGMGSISRHYAEGAWFRQVDAPKPVANLRARYDSAAFRAPTVTPDVR